MRQLHCQDACQSLATVSTGICEQPRLSHAPSTGLLLVIVTQGGLIQQTYDVADVMAGKLQLRGGGGVRRGVLL